MIDAVLWGRVTIHSRRFDPVYIHPEPLDQMCAQWIMLVVRQAAASLKQHWLPIACLSLRLDQLLQ